MFNDVGVLIYVFDIESREVERDLGTYAAIIRALEELSPNAWVFCLVHKMDLVQADFRQDIFLERSKAIRKFSGKFANNVLSFPTTIWDQSLYKAWGNIVNSLIPNLDVIENYLNHLAKVIEAEEVVLFEQTTFLTVKHVRITKGDEIPYPDRLERLSHIIKTFKHSLA
jgi:Ras-related GTP-binding protein A/B